jgi:transposase
VRLGFEATSTYMVGLQKYFDSLNLKYILINPKKIHHFIKFKHKNSKTDKLDSFFIADYISTLDDSSFSSSHSETKQIFNSYHSFIRFLSKSETHLKALEDSILNSHFTSSKLYDELTIMRTSLKKTKNHAVADYVNAVKTFIHEYDLIKSDLIGVSDMTLLAVLPLIYENSETYSIKQIQSYFGLNPVYKESGSSVNKMQKISKYGNNYARSMLYMSALSSITHNSEMKIKYDRLVSNGKPKKVALIAIASHTLRAIVTKLNYYKSLNK